MPPRTRDIRMPEPATKSLMRSLGEFFGHIVHGARKPVGPEEGRRVLKHEVEQETRDTPQGKVVLRRTTVEEVEVEKPRGPN